MRRFRAAPPPPGPWQAPALTSLRFLMSAQAFLMIMLMLLVVAIVSSEMDAADRAPDRSRQRLDMQKHIGAMTERDFARYYRVDRQSFADIVEMITPPLPELRKRRKRARKSSAASSSSTCACPWRCATWRAARTSISCTCTESLAARATSTSSARSKRWTWHCLSSLSTRTSTAWSAAARSPLRSLRRLTSISRGPSLRGTASSSRLRSPRSSTRARCPTPTSSTAGRATPASPCRPLVMGTVASCIWADVYGHGLCCKLPRCTCFPWLQDSTGLLAPPGARAQ